VNRFTFNRGFAKGKLTRKVPGSMSGYEQTYAAVLKVRKDLGKVADFKFESVKLRLADNTFYTPDFFILMPDGAIELHEVKGSWGAPNQDKSRVKLKVAAEQYPYFTFKAVTKQAVKNGGGWAEEVF